MSLHMIYFENILDIMLTLGVNKKQDVSIHQLGSSPFQTKGLSASQLVLTIVTSSNSDVSGPGAAAVSFGVSCL